MLCVICGRSFVATAPHQHTCSGRCSSLLNRKQKREWAQDNGRKLDPLPTIDCCGKKIQPRQRNQKRCRACSEKYRPNAVTETERQETLRQHALEAARDEQSLARSIAGGRKWTRSHYAATLEAYGLPGNVIPAARLLGISPGTLWKRIRREAPLTSPLKRSVRCGRYVDIPLSISEELKKAVYVRRTRG